MLSAAEITAGNMYGIDIFQGERHLAAENLFLGNVPVYTRQGEPSQWKIHFEVDTNGILTASIQDQLTNNIGVKQMERSTTSLSEQEIKKMQQDAKMHKAGDIKETNRLSKKNKLLTACVNICFDLRVEESFKMVSESEKAKMEKTCRAITEWVTENSGAASDAFEDKKRELLQQWTTLSKRADFRTSSLGKLMASIKQPLHVNRSTFKL